MIARAIMVDAINTTILSDPPSRGCLQKMRLEQIISDLSPYESWYNQIIAANSFFETSGVRKDCYYCFYYTGDKLEHYIEQSGALGPRFEPENKMGMENEGDFGEIMLELKMLF